MITMQRELCLRNTTAAAASALGGWVALNSHLLNDYGGVPRLAMVGFALLVLAWRLGMPGRVTGFLILLAWHMGAGSGIPWAWATFFGNGWGWVGLLIWSAICALPALVLPARFYPLTLCAAVLITAATPIGMMSPMVAATSFFPGLGWLGLAAAALLLAAPAIKNNRAFAAAGIAVLFAGSILNDRYTLAHNDVKDLPEGAWALQANDGGRAGSVHDWLMRQGRLSMAVASGMEDGARLAVTYEGATDSWGAMSQAFWKKPTEVATAQDSTALLGLYRKNPDGPDWQSGLLDLATGQFYPAAVPMPLSMWHPWRRDQHMPMDFGVLTQQITTKVGRAAYVMCYEEMLLWPLAFKMAGVRPDFIISAANMWFTTPALAEAQNRSIEFQKRLWGLPLLRAVNLAGTH